jgi:hypothetical protein
MVPCPPASCDVFLAAELAAELGGSWWSVLTTSYDSNPATHMLVPLERSHMSRAGSGEGEHT